MELTIISYENMSSNLLPQQDMQRVGQEEAQALTTPGDTVDISEEAVQRLQMGGGAKESTAAKDSTSAAQETREAIARQIREVQQKLREAQDRLAEAESTAAQTDGGEGASAGAGPSEEAKSIQAEITMLKGQLLVLQQQQQEMNRSGSPRAASGTAGLSSTTGMGGGLGERMSVRA